MGTIYATLRDGSQVELKADEGISIMEILRDGGVDEVLALCGGCCSCATCHVHIDSDWFERTGSPSEDEDDLLESSDHRSATSRLSCQITYSEALDRLPLTIAAED